MIERFDDSSNKAKNMIEIIFRQDINQDKAGKMRFISQVILKEKKSMSISHFVFLVDVNVNFISSCLCGAAYTKYSSMGFL